MYGHVCVWRGNLYAYMLYVFVCMQMYICVHMCVCDGAFVICVNRGGMTCFSPVNRGDTPNRGAPRFLVVVAPWSERCV